MDSPAIGSLVVPSPSYRAAMGTGEGAALLLALRRGSGYLQYVSTDRAYWVPLRDVRRVPAEAVPASSLEHRLSSLLLSLNAEEVTLEDASPGAMRLAVDIPATSREALRDLEASLGGMLRGLAIEPGGRHALTLKLDLVSLPAPAGEGT
ncbi:MAG: hypothetical protein ACT4PV_10135 [Planctomycetaceae bacterium]